MFRLMDVTISKLFDDCRQMELVTFLAKWATAYMYGK